MAAEGMAKFGCATAPVSNWMMRKPRVPVGRWRRLRASDRPTGVASVQASGRWRNGSGRGARRRGWRNRRAGWCSLPTFLRITMRRNWAGRPFYKRWKRWDARSFLPRQRGSGYPYIGYGDLKRAKEAGRGERGPHGALRRVGLRYRRHGADGRVLSENILSQAAIRSCGCEGRVGSDV